jgi:hypothetical protein
VNELIKSFAFENAEIPDEWDWWEKNYYNSLRDEVFGPNKKRYSCGSIYNDPDEGNKKYYDWLRKFLEIQENKYINDGDRFQYTICNYKGKSRIKVCRNSETLFF